MRQETRGQSDMAADIILWLILKLKENWLLHISISGIVWFIPVFHLQGKTIFKNYYHKIEFRPNLAKMLEKRSKEETEHAEKLAQFQLERDGSIWAGRPLPNIGKNDIIFGMI